MAESNSTCKRGFVLERDKQRYQGSIAVGRLALRYMSLRFVLVVLRNVIVTIDDEKYT